MLREPLLEDGLADVRHEKKVQGQQNMKRSLPSDSCIGYDSKIAWALVRSFCCGALLRAGCAAMAPAALLWVWLHCCGGCTAAAGCRSDCTAVAGALLWHWCNCRATANFEILDSVPVLVDAIAAMQEALAVLLWRLHCAAADLTALLWRLRAVALAQLPRNRRFENFR